MLPTLNQFGDFILGLENLPSLEQIYVKVPDDHKHMQTLKNAIEEEIKLNQNMPKLQLNIWELHGESLMQLVAYQARLVASGIIEERLYGLNQA